MLMRTGPKVLQTPAVFQLIILCTNVTLKQSNITQKADIKWSAREKRGKAAAKGLIGFAGSKSMPKKKI